MRHAILESELTFARVRGMKVRNALGPPTAAKGKFPYKHRTCAKWSAMEAHEGKGMNTKPRYR